MRIAPVGFSCGVAFGPALRKVSVRIDSTYGVYTMKSSMCFEVLLFVGACVLCERWPIDVLLRLEDFAG